MSIQHEGKHRELRERLAEYAHDAWSGWVEYRSKKSVLNEDGSMTIPKWAVDRWARQASTEYEDLPQDEKLSDRDEADKMLAIFDDLGWTEILKYDPGKLGQLLLMAKTYSLSYKQQQPTDGFNIHNPNVLIESEFNLLYIAREMNDD